ncbi:MAG: substrate-binding periplasmic protein [Anaeromyxobacteraceae bacterium]
MSISSTAWLAAVAAGTAVLAAAAVSARADDAPDASVLRVAVYEEYEPFSEDGKGIDVDIARALAGHLKRKLEVMPFKAGERMEDDLRNVIWKGHYLRKERLADVMMHVPVDPNWAKKNEQVRIFAPYFRERIVVARNRNVIPNLPTLEAFVGAEKIGVQFDTLEDNYLFNAFGGRLRENLVHFPSTLAAAAALRKNDVVAVMGLQSHIEAALGAKKDGFGIAPVATPGLVVNGWDVGLAVKAEAVELAADLAKAMTAIAADGTLEKIFTTRGVTYAPPRPAQAQ